MWVLLEPGTLSSSGSLAHLLCAWAAFWMLSITANKLFHRWGHEGQSSSNLSLSIWLDFVIPRALLCAVLWNTNKISPRCLSKVAYLTGKSTKTRIVGKCLLSQRFFLEICRGQWHHDCANAWGMQILRPSSRPTEFEPMEMGPKNSILTTSPGDSDACGSLRNTAEAKPWWSLNFPSNLLCS